jgi:hypothetical protein
VLLTWLIVVRLLPNRPADAMPVAMAFGAPVFLALASLRRSVFGVEAAAGSRYSYLVVLFLLPAAGLGVDALLRGRERALRVGVIVALTALLLLVQVPVLNDNARVWAAREQEQKHRVMATAALIRDGESFLEAIPVPVYMPDLSVDDVARLDREDRLPGNVEVTRADVLTARAYLQVAITDEPMLSRSGRRPVVEGVEGARVAPSPDGPGCVDVTPRSPAPVVTLDLPAPASIRLLSATGGTLFVGLRNDAADGRERSIAIAGGEPMWLNVGTKNVLVDLFLPAGITTLCDLAPAAPELLPTIGS